MIFLTDEERNRFADYLEQEAHSDEQIIKQLELLGPGMEPGMKMYRMNAAACRLIARKLRTIESMLVEKDNGKVAVVKDGNIIGEQG